MGPVDRVPPNFQTGWDGRGRVPPNFRTYWDGPLQLLKIVRQTRAQNAPHLVSNAQNCVGFQTPMGGGTYDASHTAYSRYIGTSCLLQSLPSVPLMPVY